MIRLANTAGTSLLDNASRLCSLWMGESPRRKRLEGSDIFGMLGFSTKHIDEPAENYVPQEGDRPAEDTIDPAPEDTKEGKQTNLRVEKHEMESKHKKLLQAIEQCKRQESKLQSELKQSIATINSIQEKCTMEKQNLKSRLQSKVSLNETALKQKSQKLTELEGKLESEVAKIKKLETQLQANEAKMSENKTKMRDHEAEIQKMKLEAERKTKDIEDQKQKWELKLKGVQGELKKEQKRNGSVTEALKRYKEQCEIKVSNLRTKLKQLTTDKPLLTVGELEQAEERAEKALEERTIAFAVQQIRAREHNKKIRKLKNKIKTLGGDTSSGETSSDSDISGELSDTTVDQGIPISPSSDAKTTSFNDEMPPPSVKMVIWDMDKTLLNFHTRSVYHGPIEKLVQHVTLPFLRLVPQLVSEGIKVGVVTFNDARRAKPFRRNGGADLARPVLTMAFENYFKENKVLDAGLKAIDLVKKICIVGAHPIYLGDQKSRSKNWHIDQVIRELGPDTQYHEIMFFDNDRTSVEAASDNGIISVHVDTNFAFTMRDWQEGISLVKKRDSAATPDSGDISDAAVDDEISRTPSLNDDDASSNDTSSASNDTISDDDMSRKSEKFGDSVQL